MKKYDKGDGIETKRDINKNIVDYNTQEHIVRFKKKIKIYTLKWQSSERPPQVSTHIRLPPQKDGIRGFVGGGSPVKLRKREKINNNNNNKMNNN